MGFDGLFLGRIDYQDDQKRSSEQSREMVWETSPSLGDPADLFTGVLPNTYSSPAGFCFDTLCADAPIMVRLLSKMTHNRPLMMICRTMLD